MPSLGRTIIEKLEAYASRAHLAFVLLTPDDKMAPAGASNDDKRRARQNVIFELGYFLGTFGRLSSRVFLLHKGDLDLPSDLSGVIYIDIANGVEAAGEAIRRELPHVT
jgi:predicted nucleotide-binding protein